MSPPVPASSSAGKTSCTDLSPIDLKPFQELPKFSELKAEDQASKPLRVFYDKVNAYFLIDSQDGIGNGNGLLEPSEVDRFFDYTKYKSRDPKVNTCTLMAEAREFSKVAPQLAKDFREGKPLSKDLRTSKETSDNDLPFFQIGLGTLVLGLIIRKIVQRFRQGPPPGGTGGSGEKDPSSAPKKEAQVIPIGTKRGTQRNALEGQSMIQSANVYLGAPVQGDLSSQIQKTYGGAHLAQVSNSKAPVPVSTVLTENTLIPGMIPLVPLSPITLPAAQPLPVLRPMPLPVAK